LTETEAPAADLLLDCTPAATACCGETIGGGAIGGFLCASLSGATGDCTCLNGLVISFEYDIVNGYWVTPTGGLPTDCLDGESQPMDIVMRLTCTGTTCDDLRLFVSCGGGAETEYTPDPGCTCDPLSISFSGVTTSPCCTGTIDIVVVPCMDVGGACVNVTVPCCVNTLPCVLTLTLSGGTGGPYPCNCYDGTSFSLSWWPAANGWYGSFYSGCSADMNAAILYAFLCCDGTDWRLLIYAAYEIALSSLIEQVLTGVVTTPDPCIYPAGEGLAQQTIVMTEVSCSPLQLTATFVETGTEAFPRGYSNLCDGTITFTITE
jgi:hypothetical protein